MRFARVLALCALLVLAVLPASLSARWVDFGAVEPYGEAEATLLTSGSAGVTVAVEIPGVIAEDVSTDLGLFTSLSVLGRGYTIEIGAPMLPVVREHIEIPQGATPRLRILNAVYTEGTLSDFGIDHPIYPVQPPVEKIPGALEAAEFVIDDATYAVDAFGPDAPAVLGDVRQSRAHRHVELEIYPVQYNPASGTVRVLTSIEIAVDFEGADWALTNEIVERYASPAFDELAAANLLNAHAFSSRAVLGLPIGYLIITHDPFYEAIQTLAGLRHRLGYETTVTRTSDIPGGATTTAIKNYIQEAYDTWPVPPTFILLIGDYPQIPGFQGVSSSTASDLYYTAMDGAADWLPDILIGRFSCTTESQVAHLADKTTDYIRYALGSGTDWIKKATFMASSDNYTVSEGTHNYVISTWLEPDGYTVFKRYSVTYSATTQQCIDDINGGISQLTYSGHGSTNGWADGPPMNPSHVNALTNEDMLPLVQSYACITGNYQSECFGETWTLAPHGTMAFYGSSANSYWTEDDILEKGVYDAWFGDGVTWLRGFLNEGMWDVYEAYGGGGATRRYYEMYNLFGDPALDIWTDPPTSLQVAFPGAFPIGGSAFPVDVSTETRDPVENALVCVYMDGEVYETAYTDAAGHVDIVISTPPTTVGQMEVWVSKHNCLPFSDVSQVIVPVTYEFDPPTIPVTTASDVTVTIWDQGGAPLPNVVITVDGWSLAPTLDTTDAAGEAHFTLMPGYGEDLTVVGREIGNDYDSFSDVLPVTGAASFASADIEGNVPAIGLYGSLAPLYEGTITGTASENAFTLFAVGCGVDASVMTGGTSVDLLVTPTSTGTINAAIGKKGFNVYLEDITVQTVYGQMAGEVYEAARGPIVGAAIKGYPAGSDTTGAEPVFEAVSGAGGVYAIEGDLEVAYYDVYVSKFGYLMLAEEIFLQFGANDVDFSMEFAPAGVVSGVVTEVGTGTPLEATIKVYRADNMELYEQLYSDPFTGTYAVTLPYFNYVMNVRAYHHIPETRGIAVDGPTMTENFVLEETLANLLVLDDSTGKRETVKVDKTGAVLDFPLDDVSGRAKSANEFATDLTNIGYDVTVEPATTSDPGTWMNYDFIISTSGNNLSPVEDASYRAALESYVTAGGKLLIEGGEVGYDSESYPGYPSFTAIVLHIANWDHDSSGSVTVYDPSHPLASTPNTIAPFAVNYVDYGDHDSNTPSADAHVVCSWSSYSGLSSVQVYDDTPDPTSGQIVYYTFNYAAAEATARVDLLQNTVVYLTAQESLPTAGISGTVLLQGQLDNGGIMVMAYPGEDFAYTDATGHYEIDALYAGTYMVKAIMDDWSTGIVEGVVVVEGQMTSGVDMMLFPQQTAELCEAPGLSIPDNSPVGVYDTMMLTEDVGIDEVEIYVNITHTYIGDLIVEVTSPEGTTVRLHSQTGGTAENIIGWYPTEIPVDGPGSLEDMQGESCAGEWEIWVSDNAGIDTGVLNDWCVRAVGAVGTGIDDEVMGDVPAGYVLKGASPNPFNPVTKVSYGLPKDGAVALRVYNVAGQLVRVLVDGHGDAGFHTAVWDGRDDRGVEAASGVYFCRMEAESFNDSVKMVLLK